MPNSKLQLRNVQNVAASKTALIDIPIGPRYKYIVLSHGYAAGTNTLAATMTNISEVRVKVNGRVQRTYSGTQLRDLLLLQGTTYDGIGVPNTAPGGTVAIWFEEPWRKEVGFNRDLAWATSNWSSFQIEVDLGAASTPTLTASAVVDGVASDGQGDNIIKVIRQSFPAAGTSFDIAAVDRRDLLAKISLYPDSGGSNVTTKVTGRLNSQIFHELAFQDNKALLTNYGMTPAASGRTASITDIVLDNGSFLDELLNLNGSRDFTLTVEAGSAMSGTVTALIQRLGPPE